ncbi:MAG: branched-chain amino acid ABC transporter permease [Anaerolineae bacterium]|nr:branched-chain amino acid ABC transporter permease [Anaerolineae bacterium]
MGNWSYRRLRSSGRTWLILSITLLVVGGGLSALGDTNIIRIATNFFILCTLVVALQVFVGNSGIVSFGHVAFFGVGAYTAALLTIPPNVKERALPMLPDLLMLVETGLLSATLGGALVALLFALFTGLALARMQEQAMAMATLALLVMMHAVFSNWEEVTRGTTGLYGIPRSITLWSALVGIIVISGLALLFKASPTGLYLQASREDPLAAQTIGINLFRVRLIGWLVSGALMGGAGALWAQNILAFGPDQFYFVETFTLLSMLVIGGLGSVSGAITGAAVVTVVSELLRDLEGGFDLGPLTIPELPGLVQLAVAVLIMVILIFRPEGLLDQREVGGKG